MFCNNCVRQIEEGSKFCNACGQPVEEPTSAQVTSSPSQTPEPQPPPPQRKSSGFPRPLKWALIGIGGFFGVIFAIFIVLAALEDFTGITISPEVTKTPEDAPTQSTASEETEYALFQERLRAGADCPELFDIRNSADPKSLDIPKMNDGLREIGCRGSSSTRPTPTPIDAPQPANTYTVQEYRLYRAIIDTPVSIPESQALPAIARQHNVTPDKVRQAADKVMTALSRNNWFGTPASEIKHASDWQGETQ